MCPHDPQWGLVNNSRRWLVSRKLSPFHLSLTVVCYVRRGCRAFQLESLRAYEKFKKSLSFLVWPWLNNCLLFLSFSPAPPRWGIGVRETNGVIEIEVENDGMEREKKGACYFLFEWVDTKSIQLVFHDLAIKVMKSCAVYITDHM